MTEAQYQVQYLSSMVNVRRNRTTIWDVIGKSGMVLAILALLVIGVVFVLDIDPLRLLTDNPSARSLSAVAREVIRSVSRALGV